MTDRTAVRFMQAAEAFAGKSDTVSDLPVSILYALAAPSTPEPIREEFMREAEATGSGRACPTLLTELSRADYESLPFGSLFPR